MKTIHTISKNYMTTRLLRFDWAMKKLLRSKANFGILEGFLSELLGRDLKILELPESESNKDGEDDKFNRVDILVKLDNIEIVLIEIQVNTQYDYFHRMLYGTAKAVTEHMLEGQAYANIKKIFSVNILYFDLGHGSDYIYHGTTSFIGIHDHDKLNLNEKQKALYQKKYIHEIYPEYYLIKVNKFNDIAKNTLDEWIYFLKNEKVEDNFSAKGLSEAREKLASLKLSKEERKAYDRFLENCSDKASTTESNFNAGKIEGKIEAAKKMQMFGISKKTAQEITGLSTKEIDQIFD
jgi:predicted transposase/invertase (TIGR01784 family)